MQNITTKNIPSGWRETTLGELAQIQTGPFGSQLHEEDYVENGTPMITVEHLVDNSIKHDLDIPKVSDEDKIRLKKYTLITGDIVYSRVGSVDRCAYVTEKEDGWMFSGRLLRVRMNKKEMSNFIFYWLSQPLMKEHIKRIAVGATMPSLNTNLLSGIPVMIPPLEYQQLVSDTLSRLDDKIDLLRRQNKTLENMAQAIFKEWFVNFNFPDENGKPYKSGGGKMIGSELGEIPEGWKVEGLGQVTDISIGRTPPRNEEEWFSFNKKNEKWISIRDLGNAFVYVGKTSEYLTEEAVNKFNIPVIPENTVVLSFKLTIGRVAITTEKMLSNEAIAHLKIKNDKLSSEFIYLCLKNFDFNSLGSTSSIATAFNSQSIKEMRILIPDKENMNNFYQLVKPIFAKIRNNFYEIETLSCLRDTLLPKLMRGEIRVDSSG